MDPVVIDIAHNCGVSMPEVVIAWVLSQNMATIHSSSRREILLINLKGRTLTLTDEDTIRIDRFNRGDRQAKPAFSPASDA